MPSYEYQCENCNKTFEHFQSMKDDPQQTGRNEQHREKTGGKGKVKRLRGTGAGLIFKGSGFYITDYRSEGYKAAAKKGSGTSSSSAGETKAPAKTESKPAAKEKPKSSTP